MKVVTAFMIIIGLALIGWGFWASDKMKSPWNVIGALCAPVGLVIALLGVLLFCVPNFF